MNPAPTGLPYRDTKPQGAADFYFAINATFRFIIAKTGLTGWQRYLEEMGRGYFGVINDRWRAEGLPAVADYWRAFFEAEPGGSVEVVQKTDRVDVQVKECPAIKHLRAGRREIVREYCRHCYHLGQARAEAAGLTMRLAGGNGLCCHTYAAKTAALPPQELSAIKEATS